MDLYPYQQDGAVWLTERATGLLADEMGLGKTRQAIAAADWVGAESILVVCPAVAKEVWRREFLACQETERDVSVLSPSQTGIPGGVCILGFPNLSLNTPVREALLGGSADGRFWDVLIIDEAHYLKSPSSQRTQMVYGRDCRGGKDSLVYQADRVWLLSGTPAPNHYGELYPHLRALSPDRILSGGKPMSQAQFEDQFCAVQTTTFGGKTRRPIRRVTGSRNGRQLKAVMEDWVLRRKKTEVLPDLPPLRFVQTPLTLGGDLKKAVASLDRELRKLLGDVSDLDELLRRPDFEQLAQVRRALGELKASPAAEFVQGMLDGSVDKLVVFAHHHRVLDHLREHLAAYNPRTLDGRDSASKRSRAVDDFQNDPSVRVIIAQIQAAGTAVTLTASSNVVFAESDWVPANMMQAASRCHRIGTKAAVLAQVLYAPDTLDEQIQGVLTRKATEIATLFS